MIRFTRRMALAAAATLAAPVVRAQSNAIRIVVPFAPGGSTDAEPSSQELADLVAVVREDKVSAIFSNNTVNPRLVGGVCSFTAQAQLVLSGGVVTLSNLNRYYKPSDGSVAALVAGTYFVAVRALTSTTLDAACRMSDAAVSAAVVVA